MNKKNGFTFIELIIAITIFSIIAVSVYSVFRVGVDIWHRTSPIIQTNQSFRFFFSTISSDLKNSVSYNAVSLGPKTFASSEKKCVNFDGEKQKISFMTLIDISGEGVLPHAELARVIYDFDRSGKTVRRSVATKAEGFSEDLAKPTDLLNDIEDKDFGFEYCYKRTSTATDHECEWKDAWEDDDRDRGKIPRGVKVKAGEYNKTIFIPTGTLGGKDETR